MKNRPFKVATYNANSIRARLKTVVEWLGAESPDVLCLQETKVEDGRFPALSFLEAGYHAAFRGEKAYNGVAIITREEPGEVRIGFDDEEAEGSRLISAKVSGVDIVNTYVPQGYSPLSEQFRYKLDWLQGLHEYFDRNFKPSDPLLWVGDFNVAPEAIDVYDPEFLLGHVGFHPDEHAALARLREWGFVDVVRMHHPEPGLYSFWDYQVRNAVKKNIGWRLDHIWATRPLAEACTAAWVDVEQRTKEKPSDHTFVVAEFRLR